MFDMKSEMRAL